MNEILVVCRSLPFHGLGGMEVVAWDLAKRLTMLGEKVRVITTRIDGYPEEFIDSGVKVISLSRARPRKYSIFWWVDSYQYFKKNCMHSTKAVVSVSAGAFSIVLLKKNLPNINWLLQVHGTALSDALSKIKSPGFLNYLSSVKNFFIIPRDLYLYSKFDSVVAIGDQVHDDLLSLPYSLTVNNINVSTIRNGIDDELFKFSASARERLRSQFSVSDDAKVFVTACRLHVQKGVNNVVDFFSGYVKDQVDCCDKLLIIGDGPARTVIEDRVKKLGIESKVIFAGSISREDVPGYLSAADVFMFLTDRVEGLPLNVLEALANGLPCVVSKHLKIFDSEFIKLVDQKNIFGIKKTVAEMSSMTTRESKLPFEFTLNSSILSYQKII